MKKYLIDLVERDLQNEINLLTFYEEKSKADNTLYFKNKITTISKRIKKISTYLDRLNNAKF